MNKMRTAISCVAVGVVLVFGAALAQEVSSTSGVRPFHIEVKPDPNTGRTTEQENIAERYHNDNKPGAIKHFYVIAPKSGQIILYSTVQGKVTSGGKRLAPKSMIEKYDCGKDCTVYEGQRVLIGGAEYVTTEPIQDDGTYGTSASYLYWYDAQGRYHQQFFLDGMVIAILDQPLTNRRVMFNADIAAK